MKKILAFLLAALMIIGVLPATTFAATEAYVKISSMDELTTGTYVITFVGGGKTYAATQLSSGWIYNTQPVISGDQVTDTKGATWTITVNGSSATLTDAKNQTVKPKAGNNNGIQTGSYNWAVTANSDGTFTFKGTGSDTTTLAANSGSSYQLRAYKNTTVSGNANGYPSKFTLYKLTTVETGCTEHTPEVLNAVPPTCTDTGLTEGSICANCGTILVAQESVPVIAHTFTDGECTVCGLVEAPAADSVLTLAFASKLGSSMESNQYTTAKYYITGEVISVENTTYGNLTIQDETGSLYIYGVYSSDGKTRYDALTDKPVVGDTITLYGQVGQYGGKAQMKNSWLIEIHNEETGDCEHANTTTNNDGKAATCTENGLTASVTCDDCGAVVTAQTEIPALGHYFEDGECVECGEPEQGSDVAAEATITFDSTAKRTEYSTSKQVWVENGITVTNNKAASTSNVGDYAGPARFYKSSQLIIEYPSIVEIVFDCNNSDYATALGASITSGHVTVNGDKVTVILTEEATSYTVEKMGAQVRVDGLTVKAKVDTGVDPDTCVHTPVAQDDAVAPTCTTVGYTASEKCSKCGTVTKFAEEIPALGHSYVNGLCGACGEWAADSTLTIPQATELGLSKEHNAYTASKYYMTVVIVDVYQTTYGNMNVTDAEGNKFVIYGTYSADGKTSYGQLSDKPVAGDTITVYGIIGQYNGTAQMKNAWITDIQHAVCEHTNTKELEDGKEPTCTETGLTKTVVCADCGETVTAQTEIPAYGHAWVEQEEVAPTCIHTGHLAHFECCVCLVVSLDKETLLTKEEVQLAINPDAHAWDEGVYTEPTTEADGYTTYTCGNCGATEVEVDEGTMLVPVPTITAQPAAVTVNSGDKAQFTVAVTGGEVVSYKWEYRAIWKWFNTTMTGYDTDTLTVPATGTRNGYDYRCTITFADGTVLTTEPAEMTVNTVINILDNPNNQLVALGYKGQFTVLAEGEGLKYQWQYQRPDGERWIETEMEGSNKPTVYIETTAARDGYKYRCMITDAAGTVAYSEYATMTVLYCAAQPADVRTSAGQNVTFSVETNETPVRYEWEYRKTETGKWMPTSMTGYNTATLTVEATTARNGYQYRCVITGGKDSKLISKVATLYVGSAAEITSQPEDATAAAGATATFTVAATNVLNYQWQYTKNGTEWFTTTMTGAKTATLEVAATTARNGYQYRCMITGENGDVIYTNAATLTVQ